MIRNTYNRSIHRYDTYHRRSSLYVSRAHRSPGHADIARIVEEVKTVHYTPNSTQTTVTQFEETFKLPPKPPTPSITKRLNTVLPEQRRRVAL